MNQIERIQYYEEILDEAKTAISKLEDALENYHSLQEKIKELETYYDGPMWMKDYKDDEKGKIPKDLKRGVLSEDAVYNILDDNRRLQEEIRPFPVKQRRIKRKDKYESNALLADSYMDENEYE